MLRPPARPPQPPPALVPGNDWTQIEVPEIGEWEPTVPVTVVLPYYERQKELELTLAALTQQTYPLGLFEVIVVDDGSQQPPEIPDYASSLTVEIVVQKKQGFGLTRARNLGAATARGDILVFIDSDMIPERQHVEAHARWHHVVSDAVVIGFRWHADFSACDANTVSTAVRSGRIRNLVSDQNVRRPEWLEEHFERTAMLTQPSDAYYRVMSGGNLSIRKDFYLGVGGNDPRLDRYGGEDNEFGFRLLQAGAIVIPDRKAVCWHQGEGDEPSPEEDEHKRLQEPVLANLIAEQSYRKSRPGCTYSVPFVVVSVDAQNCDAATATRSIESILGSRFHDFVVTVVEPSVEDEAEWLRRRFRSDGRVEFLDATPEAERGHRFTPLRLSVPAGALFHPGTMDLIIERMTAGGLGALHLTLPEIPPSRGMVHATTTRARSRAQRHASSPEETDAIVGRLFGERWERGTDFGLGVIQSDLRVIPSTTPLAERGAEAKLRRRLEYAERIAERRGRRLEATKEKLEATRAKLEAVRARKSLRFAEALGRLRRARSVAGLRSELRTTVEAFRR